MPFVMMNIEAGPHYELPSTELAKWVEAQGPDCWWNVEGDPLLTGLVSFPSLGGELAAELRRLDRPLLVQSKSPDAKGQRIDEAQINGLVTRLRDAFTMRPGAQEPIWANDRVLDLCWKSSPVSWLLVEDSESKQDSLDDAAVAAGQASQ